MIVNALNPAPEGIESLSQYENPIEVVIVDEDGETGVDPSNEHPEVEFYANLAEYLDDSILQSIGDEVLEAFEDDLNSRKDWEKIYSEGIELLGLGIEERTEPWEGASGVTHPLIAESAIRFQAEAITEMFPAAGPVKTTIIGKQDKDRSDAAKRVEDDMNWRLTTQMKEYRGETERMLWNLAIMGSAFKKVHYDSSLERQTAVFVSAEDIVVPYGATDISTTPRIAHVMKRTKNDVKKLQNAGFYRNVDLSEPTKTTAKKASDKIAGINSAHDDRYELIEMQMELEIEGFEDVDENGDETGIMLPFIVTVERSSGEVLAVYRNWKEDDDKKNRMQHFVHYIYVPGFGFYGMGLVHLVGGFAKSATSLIRQLIDAGSLANLAGGWKSKGMRIQRDADPIAPGEFRDVDCASGTLRDNILPLPFKEPSQTLLALFNEVVEEGRRMASVSDVNAADLNAQAPVGTTLAILERSLKVMSAIKARLHAALKDELCLLKDIVKENMPDTYDYDVDGEESVKQADYDIADIIPVSDPNASTMAQRVVQYQAVIQMAQGNPTIYDQVELNRQMLEILGIKNIDKIIPATTSQTPVDPVTENMALVTGKPCKAFAHQNHEAHMAAHNAFLQDPKVAQMIGQNPQASVITAAIYAHIAEHVGYAYKQEIESQLGQVLPGDTDKISPEAEQQISQMVAQQAQLLLQRHQQEQASQAAQQAAQDPVLQAQQAQLEIDKGKLELDRLKLENDEFNKEEDRKLKILQMALEQKKAGAVLDFQKDHAVGKLTMEMVKHRKDQQQLANMAAEVGQGIGQ